MLFRKKKPTGPTASDLTRDEQAWLQDQRAALGSLPSAAAIAAPSKSTRLQTCDALLRWWHRQPGESRPDPNELVSACGVALGDVLSEELGLEWKIITDAFGTDLGLWREQGHIVLSPTHSIAKRFAEGADGFVVDLAGQLRVMFAEMATRTT